MVKQKPKKHLLNKQTRAHLGDHEVWIETSGREKLLYKNIGILDLSSLRLALL